MQQTKTGRLQLRLPEEDLTELRSMATKCDVTISEALREGARRYLEDLMRAKGIEGAQLKVTDAQEGDHGRVHLL